MHRTCFPCTILPEFTILKDDGLEDKLKELCDKTKAEPGCLFFGFARSGNKLLCREAYVDGKAVNEHFENIVEGIEELVNEGFLKMDRMSIHGPEKQLEVIKQQTDVSEANYAPIQTGFSQIDAISETKIYRDNFVSIYDHSTLVDEYKAWSDYLPDLAETTKGNEGCYVYNFDTNENELYTIQHHKDANAVQKNALSANHKFQAMLEEGVLADNSLKIMGPKEQLDALKPTFESFHPTFFTTVEGGFSRIAPSKAEALKRPE